MNEATSPVGRWRRPVTLVALFGLAFWFFGNLYEAVVFSPNWILDSDLQLQRLNAFFVRTSPTTYFLSVPPVAVLCSWVLAVWPGEGLAAGRYRRAGAWSVAAFAINALIVAWIIPQLFGPEVDRATADELRTWAWRWNALNVARMALVAGALVESFRALALTNSVRSSSRPSSAAWPSASSP